MGLHARRAPQIFLVVASAAFRIRIVLREWMPGGEWANSARPSASAVARSAGIPPEFHACANTHVTMPANGSLTKHGPWLWNVCTIEFTSPPGASVQARVGDHTRPGPPHIMVTCDSMVMCDSITCDVSCLRAVPRAAPRVAPRSASRGIRGALAGGQGQTA